MFRQCSAMWLTDTTRKSLLGWMNSIGLTVWFIFFFFEWTRISASLTFSCGILRLESWSFSLIAHNWIFWIKLKLGFRVFFAETLIVRYRAAMKLFFCFFPMQCNKFIILIVSVRCDGEVFMRTDWRQSFINFSQFFVSFIIKKSEFPALSHCTSPRTIAAGIFQHFKFQFKVFCISIAEQFFCDDFACRSLIRGWVNKSIARR